MKILLHAYKKDEVKTRLKDLIETEMLKVQIVQTNSQQHLSKTLCRPLHNFSALIAFIELDEDDELEEIDEDFDDEVEEVELDEDEELEEIDELDDDVE
ncbi:hypothetical protein QUF70_10080, partial [Desulfobacterales bacterium HSG17]|nr:hypothetical protein [Desulfobacterales bacterium HSG17]